MKRVINPRTYRLNRRTFLRSSSFGVSTIMALPLLEAMFKTGHAFANAPYTTPRFFAMYTPNGIYHEPSPSDPSKLGYWFPQYDEVPGGDYIFRPLKDLTNCSLTKFDEYGLLDEITLLEGLQNDCNKMSSTGNIHLVSIASWLTGHAIQAHGTLRDADMATRHRMSMDQEVSNFANSILAPGVKDEDLPDPDRRVLRMAGNAQLTSQRYDFNNAMRNGLNWSKHGEILALDGDLRRQFNALYSTATHTHAGFYDFRRRTRLKLSVLDDVQSELAKLQGRLGSKDLHVLQRYTDNLRDIEKALEKIYDVNVCDPLIPPIAESEVPDYTFGTGVTYRPVQPIPHIGEHMRAAAKITAHAFSCGLIHAASYCCGGETSNTYYKDIGVDRAFHNNVSSNRSRYDEEWMKIDKQHCDHAALFMKEMKDIQFGEGDLLDNTAVMFGSGLGDASRHEGHRIALLVGGRFGTWRHGRHYKFNSSEHWREARVNDVSQAKVVQTIREQLGIDPETVRQPFDTKIADAGTLLNKGTLNVLVS